MTKEERILFRLKELIEEKLPDIIREENQGHNDGIILEDFAGVVLFKGAMPLPYVKLSLTSGECTEKDRIVQNRVYDVCVEMVLAKISDSWVVEARYRGVFDRLFAEYACSEGCWEWAEVRRFEGGKVFVVVRV